MGTVVLCTSRGGVRPESLMEEVPAAVALRKPCWALSTLPVPFSSTFHRGHLTSPSPIQAGTSTYRRMPKPLSFFRDPIEFGKVSGESGSRGPRVVLPSGLQKLQQREYSGGSDPVETALQH